MRKLIILLTVALILTTVPRASVGQDKDPFGSQERIKNPDSKKRRDDPFAPPAASDDDPFRSNRKVQPPAQPGNDHRPLLQNGQTDRDRAIAALVKNLQNQILDMGIKNKHLAQKTNAAVEDNKQQKAMRDKASQLHSNLLWEILNSPEEQNQKLALDHIDSTIADSAPGTQLIPAYSPAVIERLESLVDSDEPAIHEQSVRILSILQPSRLRSIGFQFGKTWEPVDLANKSAMKIHRSLNKPCSLNFDQTTLEDILQELSEYYQIDTRVDGVDPSTTITFKASSIRLGAALEMLLEEHNLTFCVTDTSLFVLKKDNPKAFQPRTYHVRGLLTEELDLPGISKLINGHFTGDDQPVKTLAVDAQRLVVIGTEIQHRRVARLLGQLIQGK